MVWLVTSSPHMEKAVVGIPAFPCAHRRMSACGLLWYDKGFANWLTVTMERERISFSKWHDIYPFLSKYPSLGTRKTLLSWLQNGLYLVHRRRHNMTGPGLPKSASSDWSQLWLAETTELRHPPALFKRWDNTSGAFTMLGLCPTASFMPGVLKSNTDQTHPGPWIFWDLAPSMWLTMESRGDCTQLLHVTWWLIRLNHLHHLTYHYHHYQSVTSASWLHVVSHCSSMKCGNDSMALIDLVLCTE